MKSKKWLAGLGMVMGCAMGVLASAKAGDAAPVANPKAMVKYREASMKVMGGHMGALSAIVKGEVPFNDQMLAHAEGLLAMSKTIPSAFPAGTGPDKVPSESKPAIWKEWDKFVAASKTMETESAKLVELAKAGNYDAAKAQFANVGKACGSCHDAYRQKD